MMPDVEKLIKELESEITVLQSAHDEKFKEIADNHQRQFQLALQQDPILQEITPKLQQKVAVKEYFEEKFTKNIEEKKPPKKSRITKATRKKNN